MNLYMESKPTADNTLPSTHIKSLILDTSVVCKSYRFALMYRFFNTRYSSKKWYRNPMYFILEEFNMKYLEILKKNLIDTKELKFEYYLKLVISDIYKYIGDDEKLDDVVENVNSSNMSNIFKRMTEIKNNNRNIIESVLFFIAIQYYTGLITRRLITSRDMCKIIFSSVSLSLFPNIPVARTIKNKGNNHSIFRSFVVSKEGSTIELQLPSINVGRNNWLRGAWSLFISMIYEYEKVRDEPCLIIVDEEERKERKSKSYVYDRTIAMIKKYINDGEIISDKKDILSKAMLACISYKCFLVFRNYEIIEQERKILSKKYYSDLKLSKIHIQSFPNVRDPSKFIFWWPTYRGSIDNQPLSFDTLKGRVEKYNNAYYEKIDSISSPSSSSDDEEQISSSSSSSSSSSDEDDEDDDVGNLLIQNNKNNGNDGNNENIVKNDPIQKSTSSSLLTSSIYDIFKKDMKLIYEESKHLHSFRESRVSLAPLPLHLVRDYDKQDVGCVDLSKIDKHFDQLQRSMKQTSRLIAEIEAFKSDGRFNMPQQRHDLKNNVGSSSKDRELDGKYIIKGLINKLKGSVSNLEMIQKITSASIINDTSSIIRVIRKKLSRDEIRKKMTLSPPSNTPADKKIEYDEFIFKCELKFGENYKNALIVDKGVVMHLNKRNMDTNFKYCTETTKYMSLESSKKSFYTGHCTTSDEKFNNVLVTKHNKNQRNLRTIRYFSDGNKMKENVLSTLESKKDWNKTSTSKNNEKSKTPTQKTDSRKRRERDDKTYFKQGKDVSFRLDLMEMYVKQSKSIINRAMQMIKMNGI